MKFPQTVGAGWRAPVPEPSLSLRLYRAATGIKRTEMAMGLFRKMTSAATLGAVDFKSDKERIATNTKKNAKATKEQNKLIAEQNKLLREQQRRGG